MAVWWGVGANGKSVLINVVDAIMGDYAIAADPALLVSKPRDSGVASPTLLGWPARDWPT